MFLVYESVSVFLVTEQHKSVTGLEQMNFLAGNKLLLLVPSIFTFFITSGAFCKFTLLCETIAEWCRIFGKDLGGGISLGLATTLSPIVIDVSIVSAFVDKSRAESGAAVVKLLTSASQHLKIIYRYTCKLLTKRHFIKLEFCLRVHCY